MKKLATIIFSVIFFQFAQAQHSLKFDGIDDYVDFGVSSNTHHIDNFTVEVSVKQDFDQYWPTFATNFESTSNLWLGYWMGGDDLGHAVWNLGDTTIPYSGYWLYSTTIIADSNWHTLSGTYANDTAKLFVDGILEASMYVPNAAPISNTPFTIGNDIYNDIFEGKIDDVRIWDTVRSDADILLFKDSCLNGNENNLTAYYHFENGLGTSIVSDLTGNGTNGTIVNADTSTIWTSGLYCTLCDFPINSTTGNDQRTECFSYTWIDGNNYSSSNNSATHNIIGGAANGCDSLVTLDLTIDSVSDLTTSFNGITITANNSSAAYVWLNCDNSNSTILGATNQTYTVSTNGNYVVQLTENGCVDTSASVAITTVGFIENTFLDKIVVYPNPTKGKISIKFGNSQESLSIRLLTITGQIIEDKIFNNTNNIQLELNQPDGVYFLEITGDQENKTLLKILKD